jgi:long-chain acyl-CoA synthetase
MVNIGHYIALNARKHPGKWALTCEDRTYTYREFNQKVNRLAHGLLDLGVKKGEKVALMMKNTDYFPLSYFAAAKIGAVLVPMNFRLAVSEVSYILNQSDSVIVIADEEFDDLVEKAIQGISAIRQVITAPRSRAAGHLSFGDVLSGRESEPEVAVCRDDDLQIMYTSGTTGRPKGALFDHKRVMENNIQMMGTVGHSADDIYLHVAPLFHAGQLSLCLNPGFFTGASHVMLKDFDPVKVLEMIEKYKITFFFGVPTMYNMMLQVPNAADFKLSSVKRCGYGAAPMPAELLKKSIDLFDTNQFYGLAGLTEGGPCGIYLSPSDHQFKIGSTGKHPLIFTEVRIVDDQGCDVPPEVPGEILFRGETIMKGYYRKPTETAETIRDGWLRTGDLAIKDEDGYITFVDRIKDMIISGGENIYTAEVENALYKYPGVLEAAVVGAPDPKWGETVTAFVVLKPGETTEAEEIQAVCRRHLAGYKIPRDIVFLETLPHTASGKVQKFMLREQLRGGKN